VAAKYKPWTKVGIAEIKLVGIRPIHTETDYEAALAEIEHLFDAAPDTPDGNRLEALVTLVEAYEAQHYPIPAPDPAEDIEYVAVLH